jgi:hypothetical protein
VLEEKRLSSIRESNSQTSFFSKVADPGRGEREGGSMLDDK